MKRIFLGVAAAALVLVFSGSASAQHGGHRPSGHGHGVGHYGHAGIYPSGHRGHNSGLHYGFSVGGPIVAAYSVPSYPYPPTYYVPPVYYPAPVVRPGHHHHHHHR